MSNDADPNEFLETLGDVLLRCVLLGFLLLLFWFGFYLLAGDWAHGIHARWFELTKHQFDLMNYYGMAFIKMSVILFFLIPYVAIRLVLRKNRI